MKDNDRGETENKVSPVVGPTYCQEILSKRERVLRPTPVLELSSEGRGREC